MGGRSMQKWALLWAVCRGATIAKLLVERGAQGVVICGRSKPDNGSPAT